VSTNGSDREPGPRSLANPDPTPGNPYRSTCQEPDHEQTTGDPRRDQAANRAGRAVRRADIAQAARQEHIAENSISRWKADFLKAGNAALLPGGATRPSSQEEHLQAQVQDLTQALGEAMLEAWRWKRSAQSHLNAPSTV
jgi:transposase